jgi:hypothetical protein
MSAPAAQTGGAGSAESLIALAERLRVRATKAADDEVGADTVAQGRTRGDECA